MWHRGMGGGDLGVAFGMPGNEGLHRRLDIAERIATAPELQPQVSSQRGIRHWPLQQQLQILTSERVF